MKKYLILLTLFHLNKIAAQTPLSISTQNHCAFAGTEWEEELYAFDSNAGVQRWIDDILQSGNATQNFEVINTSVENVAAVVDPTTGKRYLLYSLNFTEKAKTKIEVYAALAHEIGHHVHQHKLTKARKLFEELEADVFMGYVLAKSKNIALEDIEKFVEKNTAIFDPNRRESIKIGWQLAMTSLSINKSAAWDNDPQKTEFLKAQFQVLPCCSPLELPKNFFNQSKTLGDAAMKLALTLDKQGYYYRSFKSYKGGFALITQMEQFNPDYTFRNDENRWTATPVGATFTGFMDYFKTLVFPQKSNFRTFVFIVTDAGFKTEERDVKVSKSEAEAWYRTGFNKLPKSVADTKMTEGVSFTALVYEFEVPDSNRKPVQNCPHIDTKRHLVQSKIWSSF